LPKIELTNLVENSYLQLSADILENEAILFYEHWQAPKDGLQKLEESLARRVAVIGNSPAPECSQLSSTLYHLWVVLDKTDETIDEKVFSRCFSAERVHQILCKLQVCGLLSDGKESAESTHTIEESCALIVGTGHGGKNEFNVACIQEWGAAALRAILVAERIKQKYVMMNVSENGHDCAQNDIAGRDATATEAAAEAKSAATLKGDNFHQDASVCFQKSCGCCTADHAGAFGFHCGVGFGNEHPISVLTDLGVEFVLKTESGYLRDAGVT